MRSASEVNTPAIFPAWRHWNDQALACCALSTLAAMAAAPESIPRLWPHFSRLCEALDERGCQHVLSALAETDSAISVLYSVDHGRSDSDWDRPARDRPADRQEGRISRHLRHD